MISNDEIKEIVYEILEGQRAAEASADAYSAVYIQLKSVVINKDSELTLTIKNGDTKQLEKFKITIERA